MLFTEINTFHKFSIRKDRCYHLRGKSGWQFELTTKTNIIGLRSILIRNSQFIQKN